MQVYYYNIITIIIKLDFIIYLYILLLLDCIMIILMIEEYYAHYF